MRPPHALIGIALVAVLGCATAQHTNPPAPAPMEQDPRWSKVDSLEKLGQYASALQLTDTVLADARTDGNWQTEFQAWMRRGRYLQLTGADGTEVIQAMEERAATATTPLEQLLHSVIAEQWWNHYQMNRWRVLERTTLAEPTDDPDTWDQATYMRKVIAEYSASLQPADSLAAIPTGDLGPLLAPNKPDLHLRPTLLDLLAHRALSVFRNSEARLAETATRFQLDNSLLFAAPEPFAKAAFTTSDTSAWNWQALHLFQQLTNLHLADAQPDALVHLTLERLGFVRENGTLTNKDSLYLKALTDLQASLHAREARAGVTLAIAQWHADQGDRFQRLAPDSAWKWEKHTAAELCKEVIGQNPGAFAVKNAEALLARLQQPSLSITAESAVLADTPFKLAVEYANLDRVWLRVVKDDRSADEDRYENREERLKRLLKLTPVHEWSAALPDDGDLNRHLSELAARGLPLGLYSVLAFNAADPGEAGLITATPVQVTGLAMAERSMAEGAAVLVMDRSTGQPIQGAVATLSKQQYRNGRWSYTTAGSRNTDAAGMAVVPLPKEDRGQQRWTITQGKDKLVSGSNYYYWYGDNGEQGDPLRTFLFTDRAIYRPGQKIFFKGIVTVKQGGTTVVKPNYRTTVYLIDANWQKADSLKVTTDAYGAFHGEFNAPEGALTGGMQLQEEHGSQSFRVEEYKRPTFEVLFPPSDTIATAAKLGREARVYGQARSYAGVPLDGAQVQWKVTRSARMPWWGRSWWSYLPWGRSTEVASGTATTDAAGNFTIRFMPEADGAIPREADPTFFFNVEASITDLNGETQSASTGISVGYRSIDIAVDLGEAIDRSRVDSLAVNVQDLSGRTLDRPMHVRITQLQDPPVALRKRLWERPDRPVISKEDHDKFFMQDVLADEDDPLTWERGAIMLNQKSWRAAGKRLPLASVQRWGVGYYLIEVMATDDDGKEVKAQRVFTVFDPVVQENGFKNEAIHVQEVKPTAEPGEKATILLGTALREAHVLMEVERQGKIAVRRWFTLKRGQQLIELPVQEADRGGFAVHFIATERNREYRRSVFINVPWSNKDLQVEWMSFRDKLLPGAKEEWRLKITGPKGEQVAAQLLAGMYDASLDHFVPHGWGLSVWPGYYARLGWGRAFPFGTQRGQGLRDAVRMPGDTAHMMPVLNTYGITDRGYLYETTGVAFDMTAPRALATIEMSAPPPNEADDFKFTESQQVLAEDMRDEIPEGGGHEEAGPSQPVTRTDFRETAFFLPDLLTDRDGSVILRFTMPEALTRWKVMGLAHTTDLKTAAFTKEVITQKPLMVTPNLPRFLREGDAITFAAKVAVVASGPAARDPEGATTTGGATLELFDPFTNASLNERFGLKDNKRPFTAGPGASAAVSWDLQVPEGVAAVSVRITAKAGGHADGEEKPLPVLTDRILVTESLPLPISKAGTKTFTLEKLKTSTSSTLRHQNLKLEFTPNPAWYAVQALPYLMEYPHDCSEQVFSRLYANSLAAHIVDQRPAIKQVFEQWKASASQGAAEDQEAFLSALEKNPELKNVVLAETPWVLNAANDRERKQRIGLLFDMQRMATERAKALKQLREAQLGNGAWPWFKGMRESRWVTLSIVSGFGHLEKLGAADLPPIGIGADGQTQAMLKRAVQWLDKEVAADYVRLQKNYTKEELAKYTPDHGTVQYLYGRSFFPRWAISGATSTAVDFYKGRLKETWLSFGLQEQAMIALSLQRLGDKETAQLIMKSLGERATRSEELGMYWKNFRGGWYWWDFPTETHALMIEAFDEVAKDANAVNELRLYLLKLKQTTDWKTTKATANACYALLLTGDNWLEDAGTPKITVGGKTVLPDKQEAGTGYFQQSWAADKITPAMGEVTVTTTADRAAWGALYWQYFEQMDKVTAGESPFSIRKQVMLKETGPDGTKLVALDKARTLKPGDKLTVRIELRSDRDMDYVHLKDLRASGLEPTETLSGYRYQGGLGWYQSTRDAATDFFFDHLRAGTYVLEYDLRVAQSGDFSNGITTAMCMYAPEFAAHSEGIRIRVGK
ncbi:MAG TPA: alpha-2-macroglobulin family protein [Flavobacteriales bacterium]|nr:alpha-2-macroglobulin family protein [Flavobacteriales bacterium]